ncbi:MAG: hypothetical protein ABSA58_21195 [Acetobacteraceae bacterium]|jgi:hypothetical protein
MNRGLDRLLTLTFGAEGNEANYLGTGWSGIEPGSRWMIGQRSELWLEHPGTGHDLILELDLGIMGTSAGPVAQRLVVGVRDKGIAQISVSRGGTLGFHLPAAMVETPGPVRIMFIHPDFRRPVDFGAGTDDRQLSFSMRTLRLLRVLPRPGPASGPELPRDELIMRFESLGDNCEFGLVQRHVGAEPLGLLRFTFIEPGDLLRGMRTGFHGLGEPGTTEVIVSGKDREFIVNDRSFGMTFHTWQYETELDIETVRQQQSARLGFLKRKFLEDVTNGEKIFVIKRLDPLRPEEVLPIYVALNEPRRNRLLWVVPADATHPSGTVEVLLPGLLRGYVDRFAPYENAPDLSLSAWLAVCEAAWRAAGNE